MDNADRRMSGSVLLWFADALTKICIALYQLSSYRLVGDISIPIKEPYPSVCILSHAQTKGLRPTDQHVRNSGHPMMVIGLKNMTSVEYYKNVHPRINFNGSKLL